MQKRLLLILSLSVLGLVFTGCSSKQDNTPIAQNSGSSQTDPSGNASGGNSSGVDTNSSGVPETGVGTEVPPKPTIIQPKGVQTSSEGGWKVEKIKPSDIATKVADSMSGMKEVVGRGAMAFKIPGGSGTITPQYRIVDGDTFKIDYADLGTTPVYGYTISNGDKKLVFRNMKLAKTASNVKSSDASLTGKQLLDRWPKEFVRLAFRGITDKVDAWVPLTKALEDPANGYIAKVESYVAVNQGESLTMYRIHAKRNPALAKKLGDCEMEMVINGKYNIPVTIRVESKDLKGKDWNLEWTSAWGWGKNVVGAELDDSHFKIN